MIRVYTLLLLPVNALLLQLGGVSSPIVGLTLPQAVSASTLFVNIFIVILNVNSVLANPHVRAVTGWAVVVALLAVAQPFFHYMFTFDLAEWTEYFRLCTWLSTIPLAALVFGDESSVNKLKKSAVISLCIILLGVVIANIFDMGDTAYDLGTFYLGPFYAETSISVTVAMFLPLLMLPKGKPIKGKLIGVISVALALIGFVVIVLVMKRASIMAYALGVLVTLWLWARNPLIPFSKRSAMAIVVGLSICTSASFGYLAARNPEIIAERFRDYEKFKKTDDIRYLGAGRVLLLSYYLERFAERSTFEKIVGVDILGRVDPSKTGFLHGGASVPHNDYIEFLMRSGIVGLAAYLGFLWVVAKKVWFCYSGAKARHTAQVTAAMCGMLAMYLVFSVSGMVYRLLPMTCFAIVLGAVLAAGPKPAPHNTITKMRASRTGVGPNVR